MKLATVHRRGWGILISVCAIFAPFYAGAGVPWLGQVHAGILLIAIPLFVEAHLRAERINDALAHLNATIDEFMSRWRLAPEQERVAA